MYPARVKVVEVGPRDGLQSEPRLVDTATKVELIDRLSLSGLGVIEVTGLVSPRWIPQFNDAEQVWEGIRRRAEVAYPVLVPNLIGLERAKALDVTHIAVFTSASEAFCKQNINCSIEESLHRYAPVIQKAREQGLHVRAYISCVLGCPYEGAVDIARVVALARHFIEAGCYEVALSDTVGYGTPLAARRLVAAVARQVPVTRLAIHFHDTRGQALANVLACLEQGVSVVDAAVAGLGGCPYATGAAGNLATEDLVYMLDGMGIETGIKLERLVETGHFISQRISRDNRSRVGQAKLAESSRHSNRIRRSARM